MRGNMYNWVQATWNAVGGECPHKCQYCYVTALKRKFPRMREKYSGEIRIIEKELKPLGKDKIIFVSSCIDLFADSVPEEIILQVLKHCLKYPHNTYLLQTKNPKRYLHFQSDYEDFIPRNVIWGVTIETNRDTSSISDAPYPYKRFNAMVQVRGRKMVSIEPILDFDLDKMLIWIEAIHPEFVSIGADSKGNNLPEPPVWKVKKLIEELEKITEVRVKKNLNRLLEGKNENRKNNRGM